MLELTLQSRGLLNPVVNLNGVYYRKYKNDKKTKHHV